MYFKDIFASFITASELETLAGISKDFPQITEGIFDFTALKSIFANNMARFNRMFKFDKRITMFVQNRIARMTMPDDDGENAPPKMHKRKAPSEDTTEHQPKRHKPENRQTLLGSRDIPTAKHCTHPRCISENKQHTHMYVDCGHAIRAGLGQRDGKMGANKERFKNRPQRSSTPWTPQPRSANSTRPKEREGCFHCGAMDHFINVCPSYKTLKTPAFLALAGTYKGKEVQCLDTLIASVNRRVCKWCLKTSCKEDCGAETLEMASTKEKLFNDGTYQLVMANKCGQPNTETEHSRFTKDSYLSTYQPEESDGANDTTDEPNLEPQQAETIASAIMNEQEAMTLQDLLTGNDDPPSDESPDEDVDENHN